MSTRKHFSENSQYSWTPLPFSPHDDNKDIQDSLTDPKKWGDNKDEEGLGEDECNHKPEEENSGKDEFKEKDLSESEHDSEKEDRTDEESNNNILPDQQAEKED